MPGKQLRAAQVLDAIGFALQAMLMAALLLMVGASVFARYVMNASIVEAEELARYLFVWGVLVSAGIGAAEGLHVAVDLLPEPLLRRLLPIVRLCELAFFALLLVIGLRFAVFGLDKQSLLLGVPMAAVYAAVPVCAAFGLVGVLRRWLARPHSQPIER